MQELDTGGSHERSGLFSGSGSTSTGRSIGIECGGTSCGACHRTGSSTGTGSSARSDATCSGGCDTPSASSSCALDRTERSACFGDDLAADQRQDCQCG